MIEMRTNKMLKVRNAMGFPSEHPTEKTRVFFEKHNITLIKVTAPESILWQLVFPSEHVEFLFRIEYSDILSIPDRELRYQQLTQGQYI